MGEPPPHKFTDLYQEFMGLTLTAAGSTVLSTFDAIILIVLGHQCEGGVMWSPNALTVRRRLVLILAGAVCYIIICFWYISTVS